jgi:transposase
MGHLDTMQFETLLKARTPRNNCKNCGILTVEVPWSYKNSRFTLLFESFAICVIQSCSDIKAALALLQIDWSSTDSILKRAVNRGVKRRKKETIEYIGIDEKSYQRKHLYAKILHDIKNGRVIDVAQGRTKESVGTVFGRIPDSTKHGMKLIAMDVWKAYISGAQKHIPNADLAHDKFDISQYLNDAVNKVRNAEYKNLLKREEESLLTNYRQLFLFNVENLNDNEYLDFKRLVTMDLKVLCASAIKESFRWLWEYKYVGSALKFYKQWFFWATHSRLTPIKKVSHLINNHIDNILTFFKHPITNAVSEGLNAKIQSLKTAARGFRSFDGYKTRILFFCGKLDMSIDGVTH